MASSGYLDDCYQNRVRPDEDCIIIEKIEDAQGRLEKERFDLVIMDLVPGDLKGNMRHAVERGISFVKYLQDKGIPVIIWSILLDTMVPSPSCDSDFMTVGVFLRDVSKIPKQRIPYKPCDVNELKTVVNSIPD